MTLLNKQWMSLLLVPILIGLAKVDADSPEEVTTTTTITESDKAQIYAALVDYCRYSLQTASNDVARCQLYAHWGRALEKKLELEHRDFSAIRRAVAQPYLAGYQVAVEQRPPAANDSDHKGRLPEFRAFFKQKIIALYSQPPADFEELKQLVGKMIPDESAAKEIIEADAFKSLRARRP